MAAISITAGSFVPSSGATYYPVGVAGATITAGKAVYKDSNGVWQLARANAAATTPGNGVEGGLAAHGAAASQPIVVLKRDSNLTLGATVTEGTLLSVGADAAGDIASTADLSVGEFPCVFGIMKDGGATARVDFENALWTGSALP